MRNGGTQRSQGRHAATVVAVVVAAVTAGLLAPQQAVAKPDTATVKRRGATSAQLASGYTMSAVSVRAGVRVAEAARRYRALVAAESAGAGSSTAAAVRPVREARGMGLLSGSATPVGGVEVRVAVEPVAAAVSERTSGATSQVTVRNVARETASGPTLEVRGGAGRLWLDVDYRHLATTIGGDWASRLRPIALPECALTTPTAAACSKGTRLAFRHHRTAHRVVLELPAVAARDAASASPASATGVRVVALTAGASGPTGDYTATPLSPSATWQAGGQNGSFTWSYPLRVPPGVNGPTPQLGIGYDSGSVDGRTASTNNQPSWVGDGFSLESGYVERRYVPCREDSKNSNAPLGSGDLCWRSDNASLVLAGHSSELLWTGSTWKLKNDDGSKVERKSGAFNSDADKQYWVVTTADGTQYHFGVGRRYSTDTADTRSTQTVPVASNQSGEPGHVTGDFARSIATRAYRWNLDYVVDVHGNTLTYFYDRAENRYRRDASAKSVPYVRDSWLQRIEYGQIKGAETSANVVAKVEFTTEERCIPVTGQPCSEDGLTATTAGAWPDVPFDQICTSTTDCGTRTSPTFFTRKRLTSIVTYVRSGSAFRAVDQWTLRHSFPATGDGTSPSLWLTSITHTGRVGGTAALESVSFDGIQLRNRVEGLDDSQPLIKWRVNNVVSEAGGVVDIVYKGTDCTKDTLPQPENNAKRCFPSFWTAPGGTSPSITWFNKYPVESVTESDRTGRSPAKKTSYEYLGAPAWHFDDSELSKPAQRTYSDWRGYERVRVRTGTGGFTTLRETRYFRGMNNDLLPRTSTDPAVPQPRRSVQVTDSTGGKQTDHERAAGFVLEEITYEQDGGAEVSGVINTPWVSEGRGTEGSDTAYLLGSKSSLSRTRLSGGTYRTTRTTNVSFDSSAGSPVLQEDEGVVGTAGDELCTRTTLNKNTGLNLLTSVSRIEVVSKACSLAVSRPADVVKDTRMYYDEATSLTQAPTRGLVTRVEELAGWNATTGATYRTSVSTRYDRHGRSISVTDAGNGTSTTTFTPTSGGPVTEIATKNPLNWVSTTTLEPAWGLPVTELDVNLKRTDLSYDPLGRLAAVWLPGRAKAGGDSPSMYFRYVVRRSGANSVMTAMLNEAAALDPATGYNLSYTLFDGLLRKRQTQSPAFGEAGKRLISETLYDARGLPTDEQGPFWVAGAPSGDLYVPTSTAEARTVTDYDGANRPIRSIFYAKGVEKYRTTMTHGGDRVTTVPPAGDTPTMAITDARGRLVELRAYKSTPTSTAAYDKTTYAYTPDGDIKTITGPPSQAAPSGSKWSYEYDLLGRVTRTVDPVQGATTFAYNSAGLLESTLDSRGKTLFHVYDALGRQTQLREGSATGTLLVSRSYDALAKGLPVSSTRYVGGNAYVSAVAGYDHLYRPISTTTTVPASEGALAGTYTTQLEHNALTGTLTSMTYAKAGDLAAEKVTTRYDLLGDPKAMEGQLVGVSGVASYVGWATRSPYGELEELSRGTAAKEAAEYFSYEPGTRRLTGWQVARTGVTGDDVKMSYGYDPGGNIVSTTDTASAAGAAGETQCFQYDYLRRLTAAWTPKSTCATAPATATDLGGPAPYWLAYTYDAASNRLTEVSRGASGTVSRAYTYGNAGAQADTLTKVTETGPTGTRLETYQYDAAGNQLTRSLAGVGQTLAWDSEGHLSSVTEGTKITSFVYDADGERLIRRDPDGSSTLYLDGQEVRLAKGATAGKATRYYAFGGRTVALRTGAGVSWMFGDTQGTGLMEIDSTTLQVSRRRFTPFGAARGTAPTVPWVGEKGFVGGTLDASTGLTHLGAREYDPRTGRFISVDPEFDQGDPKSWNGYGYADSNPVTFSDPDGRNCHHPVACAAMFPEQSGSGSSASQNPNVLAAQAQARSARVAAGQPPELRRSIQRVADAELKHQAQKERVVRASKELIKIAADELGISDGIDCFTKGDLGACAETAVTVMSSFVGGLAGKMIAKYGLRWKKAAQLIKTLWRLGDEIVDAVGGFIKTRRDLMAARLAFDKADVATSAARACSFAGQTAVLMGDGSSLAIQYVREGDKVIATDPETGEQVAKTVEKVFVHDDILVDLVVDGRVVTTTEDHPFWSVSDQRFKRADAISTGDLLLLADGRTVAASGLRRKTARRSLAYNLSVQDIHTFHVGESAILVHNTCLTMSSVIGEDTFLTRAAQKAGRNQQVQEDMDHLFAQLAQGNMNPGRGSKSLEGTDVSYARSRRGARLFFRNVPGGVQIVAKSDKKLEEAVIGRLRELYGQ